MKKIDRVPEYNEKRRAMATKNHVAPDDADGSGVLIGLAEIFFIYAGIALFFASFIACIVAWRIGDELSDQWYAILIVTAIMGVLAGIAAFCWAGKMCEGDER